MKRNHLRWAYILFDVLAALITWVLFMYFRKTVNDASFFDGVYVFIPNYNFYSSLSIFPFCCLFIHYLSGIYLHPEKQKQVKLFFTTLTASAIISIAIFFALLLDDVVVSYHFYYYALLVLFGLLLLTTYFFRAFICWYTRRKYKSGSWTIRTAVIGTDESAVKIASELNKNMKDNSFVGFITENRKSDENNKEILGSLFQIDSLIKENNIQAIIIALEETNETKIFSIINSLFKYNIDIHFLPGLYDILIGGVKMKDLSVSPLVSITNSSMKDWELCVKRFFDIVASFISLVILLPLFFLIAICIKFDSPGPVFFFQERIGKNGKPFRIVKFRTMYKGSEKSGPQLSSSTDKRITFIGRFLRKYRFDELPQFWNILKGDMSIVGPRPERQYFINKIIEKAPYYCLLFKVRPGLTSWGPIRIGYSDNIDKMIERLNYDIIYIENMSLRTDLKILLYTIEVIFKGKGV